jgi:serine/threonine protein phosphatase 1
VGGIHFHDARGPDGIVVYAIGDVHGRLDLLTRMHREIAADRRRRKAADWRIVHLGDYVDRGPDSKGVIDFLIRSGKADGRVISLAGNHDVGFLEFLADGEPAGLFARHGGVQTARSYGVELELAGMDRFKASHRALVSAVPTSHADYLRSLTFQIAMGDFFFCHAGIRPGVALDAQAAPDLIWIREEFHRHAGLHPKVVVHGHTPKPAAEVLANRVNIDTGAFASGRLTALVIDGAEKQILEVEERL